MIIVGENFRRLLKAIHADHMLLVVTTYEHSPVTLMSAYICRGLRCVRLLLPLSWHVKAGD